MTGKAKYKQYLIDQFPLLMQKFVYDNPNAHCAITGETDKDKLTFHHLSYENLYHERLNRDGVVVAKYIHIRDLHYVHLWKLDIKIPYSPLLYRLRYFHLRIAYALRGKQYREAFYALSELVFV